MSNPIIEKIDKAVIDVEQRLAADIEQKSPGQWFARATSGLR